MTWTWDGRDDGPAATPPPGAPPPPGGPEPQARLGGGGPTPFPIRPMRFGEVLDNAFGMFRANARALIGLTAMFVVPLSLIAAFMTQSFITIDEITTTTNPDGTVDADFGSLFGAGEIAALGVAIAVSVLVMPVLAGGICRIVVGTYLGRSATIGDGLAAIRSRGWALLGGWVVVHLVEASVPVVALLAGALVIASIAPTAAVIAVGLAMAAITVAWLAFAVPRMVAVAPAIVEERLGPIAAVRRSWGLARGSTLRFLAVIVVGGILTLIVEGVIGVPFQQVGGAIGYSDGGWLLLALGDMAAQLVTVPFTAVLATLMYFDGRIRQEGFDLELMAAELEAAPDHR